MQGRTDQCLLRSSTDADSPNHQGEGAACSATFHLAEEVAWLIIESGASADAPVQAGTVFSPANAGQTMAGPTRWVDAVFSTPIQDPVCLSQIQSCVCPSVCAPH